MKALIAILWVQTFAGFICLFLAYGCMHSGAMAYEWTARVQSEYDKLAAAPGFQQPPEIDGTKHERLPAALHALAFSSMHNAGYWFFFAGGTGLTGAVMLFLAYRVQRQHRHGLQS